MSHTIGEARSVPQTGIEQMLGYLGKGFGTARNSMNKSYGLINLMFPEFKAGNLVIGESPELLEDMSFGKSLIEPSGHGFRLDSRLLDLIDVGIPVGALSGKFAKGFAKHGLEDLFKSKKFSKGERGYIGGKKSTAADLKALELAEQMKKNGNGDLPIFQKTGWWLGHPDGKPRFEFEHGAEKYIDNNALYYRKYQIEDEHANNPEIGRYIDDPEWNEIQHMLNEGMSPYSSRVKNSPLEKHYPQRYDMIEIIAEDDPGLLGSFNQPILEMMIKNRHPKYKKEMQSTFQHETQHAISGVEGFARGGTPKGVVKGLLRRVESSKKRMLKKDYGSWSAEDVLKMDKLNKFEKSLSTANYETSVALYKRLADESQARLVQERAHMTQAEMNADPFYKRYDTPLDRMLLFKQKTDPNVSGSIKTPKSSGFKLDTEYSFIERQVKDPEYFAREKGTSVERLMMTPDDYIERIAKGRSQTISDLMNDLRPNLIDKYAKSMSKGDKFPAPYIDYTELSTYPGRPLEQDGLHRAFAAKKQGINKIPVSISKNINENIDDLLKKYKPSTYSKSYKP